MFLLLITRILKPSFSKDSTRRRMVYDMLMAPSFLGLCCTIIQPLGVGDVDSVSVEDATLSLALEMVSGSTVFSSVFASSVWMLILISLVLIDQMDQSYGSVQERMNVIKCNADLRAM